MSTVPQKPRISAFDGMRTLAIILVLLHHIDVDKNLPWCADLFRYFGLGVFLFVSGFLVMGRRERFDVGRFLLDKFVRLMPLYYLALLMFALAFPDVRAVLGWSSVGIHAVGLQLLLSSQWCDPVVTLWFVGLVAVYYLFAAAYLRLGRSVWSAAVLILAFPAGLVALRMITGVSDKRLLLYFAVFVAGMLCAQYRLLDKLRGIHVVVAALALAVLCPLYVGIIHPATVLAAVQPPLFSAMSLGALLSANAIMLAWVVVSFAGFSAIPRTWRIQVLFTSVAHASYCMYLFHRPFFWLLTRFYDPADLVYLQVYLCVVGLPLLTIGAYWVQRWYDGGVRRVLSAAR